MSSLINLPITATRNFAKVALKGDPAALEEIKPISKSRGNAKPAPAPTNGKQAAAQK
ncbi:MAG: hypothetical protein ACLP05_03450 [Candidatus Kryptoniota bacterium]